MIWTILLTENRRSAPLSPNMDPTIIAGTIGAAATIIAAYIARQNGMAEGRKRKEAEIDDAPRKYTAHLERLIAQARQEGPTRAEVNARAIVSTRNSLRESMTSIARLLNSEIDRLEAQQKDCASPLAIMETVEVLHKIWPAKNDQVEIELRKVLAELGLLGRAPAQSSQKAPPPTAPIPPSNQTPPTGLAEA